MICGLSSAVTDIVSIILLKRGSIAQHENKALLIAHHIQCILCLFSISAKIKVKMQKGNNIFIKLQNVITTMCPYNKTLGQII